MANFSMASPKKPLEPADFMPSRREVKPIVRQRKRSRKQMADDLRAFIDTFNAQQQAVAN